MRIIRAIFRFSSSLKLAVILLLSLAATLAIATFLESAYSAKVAQSLVYRSPWFTVLLLVLGLNVAAAAISRYPWKKRHIPFLITHAGILTLLTGSLQTQNSGFDGLLSLEEGQDSNQVVLDEKELRILVRDYGYNNVLRVPFHIKPKEGMEFNVFEIGENFRGEIDSFLPWAFHEARLERDEVGGRPVVLVNIKNQMVDVSEWLSLEDKERDEINLGPVTISLVRLNNDSDLKKFLNKGSTKLTPSNIVLSRKDNSQSKIKIPRAFPKRVRLEDGITITFLRYMPHAVVEDGKLVNQSNNPVNPAVELTIEMPGGEKEFHTVFSRFPFFPTLHGHKESPSGIKIVFEDGGMDLENKNMLVLGVRDDGSLLYKIINRGTMTKSGEVEVARFYQTGWMGMEFSIKSYEAKGRMDFKFFPIKPEPSKEIPSAVRVKFSKDGSDKYVWIGEDTQVMTTVGGTPVEIVYTRKSTQIPFSVHLDDFVVNFDPGTENPASFESFVKVVDGEKSLSQKIWMNNPLVYGGYTFYQASYAMVDGQPKISVLQVARDPGRTLKYGGSLLISLGIIMMFWMRKWLKNKEKALEPPKKSRIRKNIQKDDYSERERRRDNEAVL